MREIFYAIQLNDGGYVRLEQEANHYVDVYSVISISIADFYDEKVIVKNFNDMIKGESDEFAYEYNTNARPEKIVRVTMEIEEV